MAVVRKLVEGQTGVVDAQLLADNVAVDLTGATVVLVLRGADGALISLGGSVTVTNAAQGMVRYSPAAGDFVAQKTPHRAHWKVTDSGGKINFFPSGAGDEWKVALQAGT